MIESSTQNSNTVHREKVNSLSRICGERVKRQVKLMSIKLCSNYAKELSIYHAIYIDEDKDGQHSTGMCRKCYLRLISCKHASISTHHCQTTSTVAVMPQLTLKEQRTAGQPLTIQFQLASVLHAVTMTCSVKVTNLNKHTSMLQKEKSQWTQTLHPQQTLSSTIA